MSVLTLVGNALKSNNLGLISFPSQKPFPCDSCKQKFDRWFKLLWHRRQDHMSNQKVGGPLFVCEKCGSFKTNNLLSYRAHLSMGHQGKECNKCDQIFDRLDQLNSHMDIVHLKKMRFECQLCERQFMNSSSLSFHQKKCSNSDPDVNAKNRKVDWFKRWESQKSKTEKMLKTRQKKKDTLLKKEKSLPSSTQDESHQNESSMESSLVHQNEPSMEPSLGVVASCVCQ